MYMFFYDIRHSSTCPNTSQLTGLLYLRCLSLIFSFLIYKVYIYGSYNPFKNHRLKPLL